MLPGVRGCVSAAPGVVRSHESFLRRKGRPWDSGLQERRHALPASSSQARCRTGRASPSAPHLHSWLQPATSDARCRAKGARDGWRMPQVQKENKNLPTFSP